MPQGQGTSLRNFQVHSSMMVVAYVRHVRTICTALLEGLMPPGSARGTDLLRAVWKGGIPSQHRAMRRSRSCQGRKQAQSAPSECSRANLAAHGLRCIGCLQAGRHAGEAVEPSAGEPGAPSGQGPSPARPQQIVVARSHACIAHINLVNTWKPADRIQMRTLIFCAKACLLQTCSVIDVQWMQAARHYALKLCGVVQRRDYLEAQSFHQPCRSMPMIC